MARRAARVRPVLLEALAQRGGRAAVRHGLLEIGLDAGRRRRHRGAEQVLQDPLAALHRRGAVADRGDRQEAAVTEQAAARAVGERHAAEPAPADVGDAVVARQALVHERVVGVDEIEDAAIVADDGVEEQLRLARERVAEVAVELPGAGRDVVELPQLQPLAGQVLDQRRGARIGQHAARLLRRARPRRTGGPSRRDPAAPRPGCCSTGRTTAATPARDR